MSSLEDLLMDRDTIRMILSSLYSKPKHQEDKHRRDVKFLPRDLVYLKLQPYKKLSLDKKPYDKLSPRYYGPYKVLSKVGPVAYKLELPSHAPIHPVFHIQDWSKLLAITLFLQLFELNFQQTWH